MDLYLVDQVSLGSFLLPIPECVQMGPWACLSFFFPHALLLSCSSPWVSSSRLLLSLSFSSPYSKGFSSKYISYSNRPSSFPFPGHFRFAWKSFKHKVSFSFCSHYVLPSPLCVLCVETTASLYAWCTLSYNLTSPRIKSCLSLSLQSTLHFAHNEGTRLFSRWNSFMSHPLSLCF